MKRSLLTLLILLSSWTLISSNKDNRIIEIIDEINSKLDEGRNDVAIKQFDRLISKSSNTPSSLYILYADKDCISPIINYVHDHHPEKLADYISSIYSIINFNKEFIIENNNSINYEIVPIVINRVLSLAELFSNLGLVEEVNALIEVCEELLKYYGSNLNIADVYEIAVLYAYGAMILDHSGQYYQALTLAYQSLDTLINESSNESLDFDFYVEIIDIILDIYANGTDILFEEFGSFNINVSVIDSIDKLIRHWTTIRRNLINKLGEHTWYLLINNLHQTNAHYLYKYNIGYDDFEYLLASLLNIFKGDVDAILTSWNTYLNVVNDPILLTQALREIVFCLEQQGQINLIFDIYEKSIIWLTKKKEYDRALALKSMNDIMAFNHNKKTDISHINEYIPVVLSKEKPDHISDDTWIKLCMAVAQIHSEDTEKNIYNDIYVYIYDYIISHRNSIEIITYQLFCNNYAHILQEKKDYIGAEYLLKDSISSAYANDGYYPVNEMFQLAYIYMLERKYYEAEQELLKCIDIYNKYYYINWDQCLAYQYLSYIYRINNNFIKQHSSLRNRFQSSVKYFATSLFTMTSSERAMRWEINNDFLERVSGVCVDNQSLVDIAYDASLFQKGYLLKYSQIIKNNVYASNDENLINTYERFKFVERYNYPSLLNYEKEMMKLYSYHVDFKNEENWTNWQEVSTSLKNRDLAIEFTICYKEDSNTYAALLLKKDWDSPKIIELCEESELKRIMASGARLYNENAAAYSCIWEKLEPYFKNGDNIYFAPHGLIHQLNIEVLCGADGKPMNKKCNLYRLSSTGNLVDKREDLKYTSATLYGGLNYDTDTTSMVAINRNYVTSPSYQRVSIFNESVQTRVGWSYLPGTAEEVRNVGDILGRNKIETTTYTDETGTEESFKALSGNSTPIIHIATHGFYLEDKNARRVEMFQAFEENNTQTISPLKRSGLMFSGGQHAWLGREIPEGIDDGVLTAEEIAGMNLTGTDLLVLSACQTGLGEITNEGVEGLQRGFKIAGVNTIIMSLWEVSDAATEVLMTKFYSLLIKGKTKREAFDAAVEAVKKEYPSPEYWAAFIMLD